MEAIWEKAREVGRLVAQTDEYQALRRANTALSEDREAVARLTRLGELEQGFTAALQQGEAPPPAEQEEYERLAGELQASATYRAFAVAQDAFERLMARIQEEIGRGIQAGEQSRIILA